MTVTLQQQRERERPPCVYYHAAPLPASTCRAGQYYRPGVGLCTRCPVRDPDGNGPRPAPRPVALPAPPVVLATAEGEAEVERRRAICLACEDHTAFEDGPDGATSRLVVGCRRSSCSTCGDKDGRKPAVNLAQGNGCPVGRHRLPAAPPAPRERLVLHSGLAMGDITVMTAAVRDLVLAWGHRFEVSVQTTSRELWDHNPLIADVLPWSRSRKQIAEDGYRFVECHYNPALNQSNQRPYHFLHAYAQWLEQELGVRIPMTAFRGDVYLSPEERAAPPPVKGPYWIVMAGGKTDMTTKWWATASYQAVVDRFRGHLTFVQCGGKGPGDRHAPLTGVVDMVGKTSLRQFVNLMYHAQGVLCPVTGAMHLAAAVPTPDGNPRACVVVAGGREPAHWEQYPGHRFLENVGSLDCCRTGGCWTSRAEPIPDGKPGEQPSVCARPVATGKGLPLLAKCMTMVTPAMVIRAIESYFEGGALTC